MSKQIYIYGIGGAEKQFKCLGYHFLVDDDISIKNIINAAMMLKMRNPSIERAFAIDNGNGLRKEYLESITKNTIESCASFKNTLETEGIEIK